MELDSFNNTSSTPPYPVPDKSLLTELIECFFGQPIVINVAFILRSHLNGLTRLSQALFLQQKNWKSAKCVI